jgi:hypothetical protein
MINFAFYGRYPPRTSKTPSRHAAGSSPAPARSSSRAGE